MGRGVAKTKVGEEKTLSRRKKNEASVATIIQKEKEPEERRKIRRLVACWRLIGKELA